MSDQNLQREGEVEINGIIAWRDKFGIWMPGSNGYEKQKAKNLLDTDFKQKVYEELNKAETNQVSFQFENRYYNIFMNTPVDESSVTRKIIRTNQAAAAMNQNATYNRLETTKDDVKQNNTTAPSKSTSTYAKSNNPNEKPKFRIEWTEKQLVTEERFQELQKESKYYDFLPSANPNNYVVFNSKSQREVLIWIGKKTYIQL